MTLVGQLATGHVVGVEGVGDGADQIRPEAVALEQAQFAELALGDVGEAEQGGIEVLGIGRQVHGQPEMALALGGVDAGLEFQHLLAGEQTGQQAVALAAELDAGVTHQPRPGLVQVADAEHFQGALVDLGDAHLTAQASRASGWRANSSASCSGRSRPRRACGDDGAQIDHADAGVHPVEDAFVALPGGLDGLQVALLLGDVAQYQTKPSWVWVRSRKTRALGWLAARAWQLTAKRRGWPSTTRVTRAPPSRSAGVRATTSGNRLARKNCWASSAAMPAGGRRWR